MASSSAHFAQAEYYVDIYAKVWEARTDGTFLSSSVTELDTRIEETLLHAADVHLKLAQALRADPGIFDGTPAA